MNKSIKIYKASAGSGKTYSLVYEYIRYLFMAALCDSEGNLISSRKQKKNVHSGILAVTFTNKSTAEMKDRIVCALDRLSRGGEEKYRVKLAGDVWTNKSGCDAKIDGLITDVSRELLIDILQDYSSFRVSTIDGFFQQVVRAFARELNLNNQYQVELDNNSIMELAVDNMLAGLSDKNKASLLDNLTDFASENADENKGWNPRNAIMGLSKLVTSEAYMQQKDSFKFDIVNLKKYRQRLKNIITSFEKEIANACEDANKILCGIENKEDVFPKNLFKWFDSEYLKKGGFQLKDTFIALSETNDVAKWAKGKYKKDESLANAINGLCACAKRIREACDPEQDAFKNYQTAQHIYFNIYLLNIVNEINDNAMEICRAKDCMILSSTTDFLNKIIDNSDTPFIYEKVGVATDHFMIDEFQDTSQLQWHNFVPLLNDSVAQGQESMLVGDVKQSIYRWRNGDWKILHMGVEEEFANCVEEVNLEYNYRSAKEIIDFNNMLYGDDSVSRKSLPKLLDEVIDDQISATVKFADIYKNASQKSNPANKAKGYVNCRFFDSRSSWREDALDAMVDQLRQLDSYMGVAVLVRTNKEAQLIADRFKVEKIPFYSSEALCIADNPAVKLIVAVLKYITHPRESVYMANLLAIYDNVCKDRPITAEDHNLLSRLKKGMSFEDFLLRDDALSDMENKERVRQFENMKSYPLLRMVQAIDSLFKLSEIDECYNKIYVQSFIDIIHEYSINNMVDVNSFLDYWKDKGYDKYISMPEGDDAVRIITIFKSKGLEFGVVFIPFVDWDMSISSHSQIKLINTQGRKDDIFDENVPILPINTQSSKKLLSSKFNKDIAAEYADSCLDKLNLFYVATTRAEQQLYVYFQSGISTTSILLSDLVHKILSESEDFVSSADGTIYEYGGDDGHFVQPEISSNRATIESMDLSVNPYNRPTAEEIDSRAQLKYKYGEHFSEGISARKDGLMMHKIFERIRSIDDVEKAVESLVRDGDIKMEQVAELTSRVKKVFDIEGVSNWFNPKWHVINETEIFINEGKDIYRPDRVVIDEKRKEAIVIDYKFGEKTDALHKKYADQVKNYMHAIYDMGYTVTGYLLYASEGITVEIK